MNDHDCESVRMAAIAASDGETPLLTPEQIAAHCQRCVACRESLVESLAAVIPREALRRMHEVNLWPAIHEKWLATQTKRGAGTGFSRSRVVWTAGAAAAAFVVWLGVAWRPGAWEQGCQVAEERIPGDQVPGNHVPGNQDRKSIAARPHRESESGDAAPEFYEIPWDPPPPVTIAEFRAKYSVYFQPEFQAAQSKRVGPEVDVDALRQVPIPAVDKSGPLGTLFIDRAGSVLLAFRHEWVWPFHEGLAAAATKTGSRGVHLGHGFVDRTGELVIPPRFQEAEAFSEGLANVMLDDKWGFVDQKGTIVIPPRYRGAAAFRDGIALVYPPGGGSGDVQFIDRQGEVLLDAKNQATRFSEGLMFVNFVGRPGVDPNRAVGYVDRTFSFVFHLGPDSSGFHPLRCEGFHDGMAAVETNVSNRWGFINREGKLVVPGQFVLVKPFSEGLAAVGSTVDHVVSWQYIDHDGKFVSQQRFFEATPFAEGLAAVLLPLGEPEAGAATPAEPSLPRVRWGYIDPKGRTAIEPRFYSAKPFQHGLAEVKENPRHVGFIDRSGKYVWEMLLPSESPK